MYYTLGTRFFFNFRIYEITLKRMTLILSNLFRSGLLWLHYDYYYYYYFKRDDSACTIAFKCQTV